MGNFRQRLREEIDYNGLLIKELAVKADISKKTLDMYVAGRGSMPPADKAVRIAKALNVSVEYLITGENKFESSFPKKIRDLVHLFGQLHEEEKKLVLDLTCLLANRNKD